MEFYYTINLKGEFNETGAIFKQIPFVENEPNFLFDEFILLCENLIKNKKIKNIIIKQDESFFAKPGEIEQIAKLLKRLRNEGKKLIYFSKIYNLKSLYLSSFCDERIIPELGMLDFSGLKFDFDFFKRTLDKLNISVEVYRRGKYKGAADRFRIDSIDDAQKEAFGRILDIIYETFKKDITENLKISESFYENEVFGKILFPEKAKEIGLITSIKNFETIEEDFKNNKIMKLKKIQKIKSFGKGKKISILIFEGGIKDGKNSKNFILGKQIGDEYFIKHIEKLRKNKKIKGVILKVNSPGGSALASDAIAESLNRLKKEKPLVVVQSGVAGSGGYFISFPGERIFTQRTTITGSIGVINMAFNMKGFYDKIGVTRSVLKKGEFADINSTFRERTPEEKQIIDGFIEDIYQKFISKVAQARAKSKEDIDKIGQGRIWAGVDGINIGITDEIGDIYSAIEYLKTKLKVKNLNVSFAIKPKVNILNKILTGGSKEEQESIKLNIIGNLINNIFLKYYYKKDRENLNFIEKISIKDHFIDLINVKAYLLTPEIFFNNFTIK
ncbi:MAG: signal peptide peptidase SppA [Spirochaetes bacterium]|nr:signal peptide peptidase SppA [Spirochaetota bacterium]